MEKPIDDQPAPPADQGFNIAIAAHENGVLSISFARPVTKLEFNLPDAVEFVLGFQTALLEIVKIKPVIQVANGKQL